MKIAVRYQSRGGNTKAVAEVIANSLGVKAEAVDSAITERVNVLFVGGGVYIGKMDESLYNFLSELNSENVGQIVCFSTTGSMASTIRQIRQFAIRKEIMVNENELLLKMLLQGHSSLGLVGGKRICGIDDLPDTGRKSHLHQFFKLLIVHRFPPANSTLNSTVLSAQS